MEEDSQPKTSMNKPEKFKRINWVQWSKEFENYVAQYKTAWKAGLLLLCLIRNNLKRSDVTYLALLPQTEQEYCNITLNNRNRRYGEDSKQVYAIFEELMLSIYGYEWFGEV